MLLGDPNQCIYTFLAEDGVRVERIDEACLAAGAENTIVLPETSFRDPSGIIPAVANAIRGRMFDSEAITTAIQDERLVIRKRDTPLRRDQPRRTDRYRANLGRHGRGSVHAPQRHARGSLRCT